MFIRVKRSDAMAIVELLTEVHQHVAFDRVLADRVNDAADALETLLERGTRDNEAKRS